MSRPRLQTDVSLWPGLAAVALFGVLAAVFLGASLPEPAGFGADAQIVKSIGAAMFNVDPSAIMDEGAIESEGFLVLFVAIAIVLDAALDGSLMLAERDEDEGGESR
jgi:NADH-quinone oxidoreductase subunit J